MTRKKQKGSGSPNLEGLTMITMDQILMQMSRPKAQTRKTMLMVMVQRSGLAVRLCINRIPASGAAKQ